MTTADKYGFATALLTLGFAGAICFVSQLTWSDGAHVIPLLGRDRMVSEMIFDAILAIGGIPSGVYLFYLAVKTDKGGPLETVEAGPVKADSRLPKNVQGKKAEKNRPRTKKK
jgi:hypothetical protein